MQVEETEQEGPLEIGIVELNVGGRHFSTTRETLCNSASPYFARLLDRHSSVHGAQRDANDRIFIDRDPELFGLILEYLRSSSTLGIERLEETGLEKLRQESLYYQLDGLLQLLPRPAYDPHQLSPDDFAIRYQAQEVRSALLQNKVDLGGRNSASVINDVDGRLVDLFPDNNKNCDRRRAFELFASPLTSPNATILFDKQVEHARTQHQKFSTPPSDLDDFRRRLVQFAGPFMDNFPMDNLVLAGGAVLQCLQGTVAPNESSADLDLFLITNREDTAHQVFHRILQHLSRRNAATRGIIPHHQLLVVRSSFAVTICVGYPQRHLQLILRLNQCVGDVIFSFDLDCCQVAYDGQRVLATPAAYRALQTGINFADPERCGLHGDYEGRLSKYSERGFLVAVPGLDQTKIRDQYLRNCCYAVVEGKLRRVHLRFEEEKDQPSLSLDEQSVHGLAKLIVYSTIYNHEHYMQRNQEVALRRQLTTVESPNAPLGSGNYLIDYNKLTEGRSATLWQKRTPPFPPPYMVMMKVVIAQYPATGSTGGPLLPFYENFIPSDLVQNIEASLEMLEVTRPETDRRLICYDYLPDVRQSTECRHVLDAQRQYPHWVFLDSQPGRLKRFLSFEGLEPWQPVPEAKWIVNVYEES